MDYKQILSRFERFLNEEVKYDEFSGDSYIIDLDNLSVVASKHAEERSRRHVGQRGRGAQEQERLAEILLRKPLTVRCHKFLTTLLMEN